MAGASADLIFTDPPYNVEIDGHVCGLGAIKHREFAFASGDMNKAQFTEFLAGTLSNLSRVMRDGGPAGPGEVGELELRNPAVMKGYWGMPEETAKVLSDDGWLRTGDLVTDDGEGTYTFVGRVKEVIRRRGENVAPAEIEEALVDHPAVFEAAVVGVPSELSEEDIKAFVVLHDPAADLAAVRDHAAGLLAPFKVPRYMQATAELPHTPTGRVAKHEITRERTPDEIDFERRA